MWFSGFFFSYFVSHSWGIPTMKITGLSHLFKWENLHNWWLTKYFFAPLYNSWLKAMAFSLIIFFLTNTCHYVSEDILLFWVENPFKGLIGYDMHFYKLFEHKCVLAVCIHNQPIRAVVGVMDRALGLKPDPRSPKVVGSNPGSGRKSTTAPRALHSRLPTAPSVYTWMG